MSNITAFPIRLMSLFSFIILTTACHFTTTTIKDPSFRVNTDSLGQSLNKLVDCQRFNVTGKEMKTDGKSVSILNIEVINAGRLSSNMDTLRGLGHQIAVEVKDGLTDAKEYETINVIFVTEKTSGAASVRNSRSFEFKGEAL